MTPIPLVKVVARVTLTRAERVVVEKAMEARQLRACFNDNLREFMLTAAILCPYETLPSFADVVVPQATTEFSFVLDDDELTALRHATGVSAIDSVDAYVRGCTFAFLAELRFRGLLR